MFVQAPSIKAPCLKFWDGRFDVLLPIKELEKISLFHGVLEFSAVTNQPIP